MSEELSTTEFAAAFSFEDWGFLCSKPDFLAAALASSGVLSKGRMPREKQIKHSVTKAMIAIENERLYV